MKNNGCKVNLIIKKIMGAILQTECQLLDIQEHLVNGSFNENHQVSNIPFMFIDNTEGILAEKPTGETTKLDVPFAA